MTSREALTYILENAIDDLDVLFDDKIQSSIKIIIKDLEVLEDFIKLFDFHLDDIPEHYFNDPNAFCSIARRIQNYLKEVKK